MILERSRGFSYQTLLGELMYSYITCQPDIAYVVTTFSKLSSDLTSFYYKLIKGVAKYLWSTINWGIRFHRKTWLEHPDFGPSKWRNIKDNPYIPFDVHINQPLLMRLIDSAHTNNLHKRFSAIGLVYTFCGGAIVYKSKTQSLTVGSSTKAEFIAAHTAAKIA